MFCRICWKGFAAPLGLARDYQEVPALACAALSVGRYPCGVLRVILSGMKCWNVLNGREPSNNLASKVHSIFTEKGVS